MNLKIIFVLSVLILDSEQLFLKQVVLLSRHNVRTPLSQTLSQTSPKSWPKWNEKPGYLTEKGTLLEGFMGEYFKTWLNEESLLPENCPYENELFVYANTAQRTLASAKSFVSKAYPQCNITIHHAKKTDPIFNPVIHNTTSSFLQEAQDIMQSDIKNLFLNSSYEILEKILDYEKSENCLKNDWCDLASDKNIAIVKTGSKPSIIGPLKISKSAIDSFIMEFYEALDLKNVAWGMLNEEKWYSIFKIFYDFHKIIFNTELLAKDLSKPLITYMTKIFLSNNSSKVTLIMGHDANIYTTLTAMGVKPFTLVSQREIIPIGGKIVFQRWSDNITDFLKIHYVYQSWDQMRDGVRLSMENPPLFQQLELNDCKVDKNGFCHWSDFEKLLMKL